MGGEIKDLVATKAKGERFEDNKGATGLGRDRGSSPTVKQEFSCSNYIAEELL